MRKFKIYILNEPPFKKGIKKFSKHAAAFTAAAFLLAALAGRCSDAAGSDSRDSAARPAVSNIIIDIQGVPGNTEKWATLVRGMIFQKEDEPYDPEKVADSVSLLKSSGFFSKINVPHADPAPGTATDGTILVFQLTPYPLIKKITVSGGFPLLEQEILDAMVMRAGTPFRDDNLIRDRSSLVSLFTTEGFIAPQVSITAEKDPEDGNFELYVDVDKGAYYKTGKIKISGNNAFPDERIKAIMSTWKASLLGAGIDRFTLKKLEDDIKRLKKFYWKKGFPDAQVKHFITKNRETRKTDIFISIDEGMRYAFVFSGNRKFWDYTLKKDLVLFSEGNRNDLGIRKSIRNIKKRYKNAGFQDCRIKTETGTTRETGPYKTPVYIRKITVLIEEGVHYQVRSLDITGNSEFSRKKLEKQILTKPPAFFHDGSFSPQTLDEDISAITSLYLKSGFMDTKIEEKVSYSDDRKENKRFADITLTIVEGDKTVVSSVSITGLESISEKNAVDTLSMKKGEPFRSYMIRSDAGAISSAVSEKGRPHVAVKGESSINDDGREAEIDYQVDEGPEVRMGKILCFGNLRTENKIIENEMALVEGEPFSLRKMLESQRNIRDINAFDSVYFNIPGLKEKNDEVNLLIKVEEKRPYFFQAGAGYDTEKNLYFNTRAGDRNFLGLNKHIHAGYEWSEIGYRGETGLREQRFLNTRFSSELLLYREKEEGFNQDFGTRSYGATFSLHRKFLQYFSSNLTLQYSRKDKYKTEVTPSLYEEDDEEYSKRTVMVITPSVSFNSVDSFIRPRQGTYSSLSVDFSRGLKNSIDNFIKYRFELRYYFSPAKRLTFALRGRTGYIDPLSSSGKIPEDELFFLGGISDVRGFDENMLRYNSEGNAVGGRSELLGSAEARYNLWGNFEFTAFFDTGRINDALTDEGSDKFRSSVGAGLRYISPICPFGLLYGHKLDKNPDESSGRVHFTVGYTF